MPTADAEPLAERAGGDLDAHGVPELGVPRCLGAPGAQRLDVGELQTEAAQVQLQVQREAAVPGRQHEPVPAEPVGVAGIVPHGPLEQRVGQRSEAHRRARMAVAHLLDRVRRQHPDRVHRGRVEFGPVVRVVGAGKGGDVFKRGHKRAPQVGSRLWVNPNAGGRETRLLWLTVTKDRLAACSPGRICRESTLRCRRRRLAVYHRL